MPLLFLDWSFHAWCKDKKKPNYWLRKMVEILLNSPLEKFKWVFQECLICQLADMVLRKFSTWRYKDVKGFKNILVNKYPSNSFFFYQSSQYKNYERNHWFFSSSQPFHLHRILESEKFRFPFSTNINLTWGVKYEKLNFRKSWGIS